MSPVQRPDWERSHFGPESREQTVTSSPTTSKGERPDWEHTDGQEGVTVTSKPAEGEEPAPRDPKTGKIIRDDWVEAQEGAVPTPPYTPLPDEVGEGEDPAALQPAEPVDPAALVIAEVILEDIPVTEIAAFTSGFDNLPDGAQHAIASGLSAMDVDDYPAADDHDMGVFASTELGAGLIEEWGSNASAHLGIVNFKLAQMYAQDPEGMDIAMEWFAELPAGQRTHILRAMVG